MTDGEDNAITELKQWYRDTLGERIEALERPLALLRESGNVSEGEGIRMIAHSLRGSGATYGFPEITKTAAEVEDATMEQLPDKTAQLIQVLKAVASGAA